MLLYFFLVLGGLVVLMVSADCLIDGAERFACRLSIPPAVVGLTVVAFGTSLPELVVAVRATLGGAGGLALGNIIGSNTANVFFVLGAAALVTPFALTRQGQGGAIIVLVVAFVFLLFFAAYLAMIAVTAKG